MTTWHTACASSASCVQIGRDGTNTLVRDSKDPGGPVLAFTPEEWAEFINGAKSGEFDWTLDADEGAAQ